MPRRPTLFLTTLVILIAGCNSDSPPAIKPTPTAPITTITTTQPVQVVAELSDLPVSKTDLDALLYESVGLRMTFDIVELDLARQMLSKQGRTLDPADVQKERQTILAGICGDAAPSSYEELFNQFLEREHLSRAEFDLKIVQTNACLRKIVEPLIIGKFTDAQIKKGFEQLYGAKRQIADIEVANFRQATLAKNRLATEPFEAVAKSMSIDIRTSARGGLWPPFSAQSTMIPKVISEMAFALEKGQTSDVIQAESSYHIIKLIDIIEPTVVKFDDVKPNVQKTMEDQAIKASMSDLRQQIMAIAQQRLKIIDPILKAQWDALVAQQLSKPGDRNSALEDMNQARAHVTSAPATQP